jgi:hypothetical protein
MDVTKTFLPVGIELIDNVFPTNIVYFLSSPPAYNPETGESTPVTTEFNIKAGVLRRNRNESGGAVGEYDLELWIHHGPTGIPTLPTTGDSVLYDNTRWKIISISPTYSSEGLIASRLTARAQ